MSRKKNKPKLVYVKFHDHAQHFVMSEPGTLPEDLDDLPIPMATLSLCGWVLKENNEAIWIFCMKTEYPKKLSSMYDLRSEGYHGYWCVLKKDVIELKEVKLG